MTISWWFLVFAVWCAVFTALALWPPRRPGFLTPVAFFASWLTSELAVWHLVWQPVVVVVFVFLGALGAWPGWVGLVVIVLSWIGLVAALVGASRTDRLFESALTEALGSGWRDSIDPAWVRSFSGAGWAGLHSISRPDRHNKIVRTCNVRYVDDGLRRHRLDVWCREGAGPAAPVLLQIHGGGWMVGSKEQQARPLMRQLTASGWVCVSINYRLSPKATWPEHLVDCKLALKWIREHIGDYGGDPGYVVVTGGSAGGHLSAMMGLTVNRPEFQPGFETVDTSVRAMVLFYGVYDFLDRYGFRGGSGPGFRRIAQRYILKADPDAQRELFAGASPLDQIHRDVAPALIVHGDRDLLAPVEEARLFAERLRESSGSPVAYVELSGAQHAFEMFRSIRGLHTASAVDAFLAWLISRDEKSSDSPAAAPPLPA